MQLDNLYQEVILDHYKRPENKGLASKYDVQVHHNNPSCGDDITLNLKDDGAGHLAITWDGVGCAISMASASVMSDLLSDKSPEEAVHISNEFLALMQSKGSLAGDETILEDAVAFAGVSQYPARIKCALLAWMAYKDASLQVLNRRR
ncbi:MAG: SUF system NifU family Fe-S cluster assembly protein [Actinomycetota bacterium]